MREPTLAATATRTPSIADAIGLAVKPTAPGGAAEMAHEETVTRSEASRDTMSTVPTTTTDYTESIDGYPREDVAFPCSAVPRPLPAGCEVSLDDARAALQSMCGDLFISPKRIKKIHRVGAGAFATVDFCELAGTNGAPPCNVAVKRLRVECFPDKETVKDFVMEVLVLSKLKHECVVQTLGVGAFGGGLNSANPAKLYIVQELLPGGDLQSVLMRQCLKPKVAVYSYAQALRWAQQIVRGLRYLHSSDPQVIHRDLKLDNVLLTDTDLEDANAKLADFGLMVLAARQAQLALGCVGSGDAPAPPSFMRSVSATRLSDSDRTALAELPAELARASVAPLRSDSLVGLSQMRVGSRLKGLKGMLGSVPYIAPEIVNKQPYNDRVDIFAFGMMLFELFARKLITYDMVQRGLWKDSAKYISVAAHKVAAGFRPEFPASFPPEIKPLVKACWQQDPKRRPSANSVYDALKGLSEEGVIAQYDSCPCRKAQPKEANVEVVGCSCAVM